MSHCRFQNTQQDLEDCQNALEELKENTNEDELNDETEGLSRAEANALINMLDNAKNILEMFGYEIDHPEAKDGREFLLADLREHHPEICAF